MQICMSPDWTHYRSLLAVRRHGSLSAAARALGLTQPTLGRHVTALEAALGAALFTRSAAGLAATPLAESLVPLAETMEAAADAIARRAAGLGDAAEGLVRITASEVVGVEVLPSILAELQTRHPGIAVELVLSNRLENLLRRDADIAVRMAAPAQQALVARRLGAAPVGLFAHASYAARRTLPLSPADLVDHAAIGFDRDWAAFRPPPDSPLKLKDLRFAIRSDSQLAQLAALRAGAGVAATHLAIAAGDPELVRVLPEIEFPVECWLAMHEDLRPNRAARTTFDALADGLARWLALRRRPLAEQPSEFQGDASKPP